VRGERMPQGVAARSFANPARHGDTGTVVLQAPAPGSIDSPAVARTHLTKPHVGLQLLQRTRIGL
jgi:hypothetical protein